MDRENLSPLLIGDSDKVRVGQIVMAIGNPFGLDESVSQGIISAKDRRAMNDSQLEFFQTDTAINPGNSGGPLVNIRGEVIGINTAIYSESGGNQGIGFAIPSNVVRAAMKSDPRVARCWNSTGDSRHLRAIQAHESSRRLGDVRHPWFSGRKSGHYSRGRHSEGEWL
jgi:S1-C subfamily serine protease